jgi:hydrogenase maturation protease
MCEIATCLRRALSVSAAGKAEGATRLLIAGVGYRNLRDLSLGPVLIDRLGGEAWPPGVELADLSYSPIAVMHNLEAQRPYDRAIFVAGANRQRPPGHIYRSRWRHELPSPDDIQARVAEAITGIISLDNLLIILTYFEKLPRDVRLIEVEAADVGWGEGFTATVERAVPQVMAEIRKLVRDL